MLAWRSRNRSWHRHLRPGPINDAPVPQVKPRSEPGSSGQSPDWLNRVTDLFQFSEKETAPTTPASPSNIAAVGPEEPAPKAVAIDQPSQIAPDDTTDRQIISDAPSDPSRARACTCCRGPEAVSPNEDPERLTRLFDAVWADDLGRVKAAITAGASISAVNELGVRPVDMAVDRGHYEIAHYLLSVEKQRRDAATQEPVSTAGRTDGGAHRHAGANIVIAWIRLVGGIDGDAPVLLPQTAAVRRLPRRSRL